MTAAPYMAVPAYFCENPAPRCDAMATTQRTRDGILRDLCEGCAAAHDHEAPPAPTPDPTQHHGAL